MVRFYSSVLLKTREKSGREPELATIYLLHGLVIKDTLASFNHTPHIKWMPLHSSCITGMTLAGINSVAVTSTRIRCASK
jgi:hypothetical protein